MRTDSPVEPRPLARAYIMGSTELSFTDADIHKVHRLASNAQAEWGREIVSEKSIQESIPLQLIAAPLMDDNIQPFYAIVPRSSVVMFTQYQPEKYRDIVENYSDYVHKNIQNNHYQYIYKNIHHNTGAIDRDIHKESAHRALTHTEIYMHTASTAQTQSLPHIKRGSHYFGNIALAKQELTKIHERGYRLYYVSDIIEPPQSLAKLFHNATPIRSHLKHGVIVENTRIALVTAADIYGSTFTNTITESYKDNALPERAPPVMFDVGDYVVHVKYGIGQYRGVERITNSMGEHDYFTVEYAENNYIYIPLEQTHLLTRYGAVDQQHTPELDSLGKGKWQKRSGIAKKHIDHYAIHLIRLYARRQTDIGISFKKDTEWQQILHSTFRYTETMSQLRAMEEICADMERTTPMERLLCGDSGFGKTEVAIRAACKAVFSHMQVAVLVPTTVLAEQHYATFTERVASLPVVVGILTRLHANKSASINKRELAEGKIDIIIGTHAILQDDIRFRSLGLLIIDEEHRFGVRDKERLKSLRANIDCLTISATPIPRSLHRALVNIHPISIISDPPARRKQTIVRVAPKTDKIIVSAIKAECARGGQIYYLHNRIATLEQECKYLHTLAPHLRICIAHGQMSARDIDRRLYQFIHRQYDLLLTTTIIENGIDIPAVNTILIDRADRFGVSSLYQLRGRVGRSDKQAYSYLLYDNHRKHDTRMLDRLHTISAYSNFGSGFTLAMRDLELRGAGHVLGRRQSGDIHAVGYELYVKMLNDAIRALQGEPTETIEPHIELHYSAYIPDDYISSLSEKLALYQKIATAHTDRELAQYEHECEHRYGTPPEETRMLFVIARVRICARHLTVESIQQRGALVTVIFHKMARVNQNILLRFIERGIVSMHPHHPNRIHVCHPTQNTDVDNEMTAHTLMELLAALAAQL